MIMNQNLSSVLRTCITIDWIHTGVDLMNLKIHGFHKSSTYKAHRSVGLLLVVHQIIVGFSSSMRAQLHPTAFLSFSLSLSLAFTKPKLKKNVYHKKFHNCKNPLKLAVHFGRTQMAAIRKIAWKLGQPFLADADTNDI